MTIDGAITHCEEVADRCSATDGDRKCGAEHRQLAAWLRELKDWREQFADVGKMGLISRQAVSRLEMGEKQEHQTFNLDDAYEQGFNDCLEKVLALPSAQPKRGRWLDPSREGCVTYSKAYAECSVCGKKEFLGRTKKFCPNCGTPMEA